MNTVGSQWRVKEAARFLSCSISRIYKSAAKGQIHQPDALQRQLGPSSGGGSP
jgi:hypothetical protein